MLRVAMPLLACVAGCAHAPLDPRGGVTLREVRIESSPTPAWIFIDGAYVGRTPVEPEIPFTHATRFVEVVAVPLHESQTRQVLRIVPPSLPRDLHFFLDNQDPQAVAR